MNAPARRPHVPIWLITLLVPILVGVAMTFATVVYQGGRVAETIDRLGRIADDHELRLRAVERGKVGSAATSSPDYVVGAVAR